MLELLLKFNRTSSPNYNNYYHLTNLRCKKLFLVQFKCVKCTTH